MIAGDAHTYCINPGEPVPTGTSVDMGVQTDAHGLSPQQLVSINYLVSTYGQTGDAVQAAAVGWAVKAIADRETTLHSWGYRGDSLPEAIDWIMRRVAPESSPAIQERTQQYLAEALAVPVPRVGGSLTLATDEDDPTHGSLTVDVDPTASGTLRLENAVFSDTGLAERTAVRGPATYAITAPRSADARPYTVTAHGSFAVRSAAVRLFVTSGQQETAGPVGDRTFELSAQDAAPRPVRFSPRISTEAHIDEDDRFVDAVTFVVDDGVWPRRDDGSFVPVFATADLYRTGAFPAESDEIPARLRPVATIEVTSDPETGAGTYRTATADPLPGPGVYTAVWRIERAAQDPAVAEHLPRDYVWREKFAHPTQTEQLVPTPPPTPTPTPTPTPDETPEPTPTTPPVPQEPSRPAPAALATTGIDRADLAGVTTAGVALSVLGGIVAAEVARRRRRIRN